jgi:hypothetical protein
MGEPSVMDLAGKFARRLAMRQLRFAKKFDRIFERNLRRAKLAGSLGWSLDIGELRG